MNLVDIYCKRCGRSSCDCANLPPEEKPKNRRQIRYAINKNKLTTEIMEFRELHGTMETAKQVHAEKALTYFDGNHTHAAKALNMSVRGLRLLRNRASSSESK
jgi:ActR/RegA family two-component response regulator